MTHIDNNHQLSHTHTTKVQLLEQQYTLARLQAEKSLQHHPQHPWSPKLRNAQLTVSYYKIWLSQFRNSLDLSSQRDRLSLQNMADPTSHTHAQHLLRKAQKQLRETITQAQDLRDIHLEDRAQVAQQTGQLSKSQAISNIKRAEKLKQMYRKIRRLTAKGGSKRFTHLILPVQDQEIMINDPQDIFHHLIVRNCHHFGQAEGSPFTQPPLTSIKDISQINPFLDNHQVKPAVRSILEQLKNRPKLPSIIPNINAFDLQQLYKIWNENTATSPSGLHLGHDKCALQENTKDDATLIAEILYKIKSQFINIALKTGIVYDRWKHINTVMIEKIPGVYHINKLRALHLFESDLNAIFGILWGKRLMHHAKFHHQLHDAQHGSRKGKGTDTLLITKHFNYALWRMTQTNGMSFDNDAKACYERIVMNLAFLISQQLGMPKYVCEWFNNVLQQAHYHIQLPDSTSTTYYSNTTNSPLHGPGQGSRAAPSMWVIISSLIMECMQQKSNGVQFIDPHHNKSFQHIMTGFVDDTTHWINDFHKAIQGQYTQSDMFSETQQIA